MTLIEFFSDSHIDNIAACLRLRPDRLVMVGDAGEMAKPVKRYKKLLQQRMQRTDIITCDVRRKDFGDLCAVLNGLIPESGECVIDLTGGDDCVAMALGAVFARLEPAVRQRVRAERFDHKTNTVRDCIHDNRVLPCKQVCLSVEELLALHGGSLFTDSYQPPADSTHEDLAALWSIVSGGSREWNQAIRLLGEFESRSDSKTRIYLPLALLRSSIPGFDQKEPVVRQLLEKLRSRGIIEDHSTGQALEYTYSDPLQRYCTMKAGNVLEVKTLLEGRSVLEKGASVFHDCRMSVDIDWSPAQRVPETHNEIDVILMQGTTPLFISCKNGNIEEEELYKLHTVARRFGGPYAKKMLIATELGQKSAAANRSFIQRAWDMDIFLVTDAAELSRDEWQQSFRQAMQ